MPGQFPRIKLQTNSEQKFNSHLLDKLRCLSAQASHKLWDALMPDLCFYL